MFQVLWEAVGYKVNYPSALRNTEQKFVWIKFQGVGEAAGSIYSYALCMRMHTTA